MLILIRTYFRRVSLKSKDKEGNTDQSKDNSHRNSNKTKLRKSPNEAEIPICQFTFL